MPYQVSPSVSVTETDLTNIIPAVSSSIGAGVMPALWGPVMSVTRIASENELVQRFGKPTNKNAQDWLNIANFLSYSGNALVVRADTTGQFNAVSSLTGRVDSVTVTAPGSGYASGTTKVEFSAPQIPGGVTATGNAVIAAGEVTAINVTNPGTGYTNAPTVTVSNTGSGAGSGATATATIQNGSLKISNQDEYDAYYADGQGVVGAFAARYPGALGNSIMVSMADAASFATWDYRALFTSAPDTSDFAANNGALGDELHAVVVDIDGKWTGVAGGILETYAFLSKALGAKKSDGRSAYYATAINAQSNFVYWMDHPQVAANWGEQPEESMTYTSIGSSALVFQLLGGSDDMQPTDGQLMSAFSLFAATEQFDVSLVMGGTCNRNVVRHVIDNVVEVRKDCVAFFSPSDISTGDPIVGTSSSLADKIVLFKNGDGAANESLPSSSYAVFDSGFKYQYDRYNDKYRWVPLNGDIAGLCARTDITNDPWFSPAGFSRGQIKNAVKLAFNPNKAARDTLYVAGINPVCSFPGQGIVLFGDKTGLAKPSAFDRINVRRLFITLEKSISTAAKYQLFEINDDFTRASFRNMVEPFLRDVKGRRGIYDFKVVCDSTNNTPEVIDSNRFVAQIFIQASKSINFIELSFIATRTGAEFTLNIV